MFREEDEIRQDMLGNISESSDKSQNSFVHNVLSAAALEFNHLYRTQEHVDGKFDIENLEGDELSRFIGQRTPVTRRSATKAVGRVIISGTSGATIEAGDLVSAGDVDFVVTENKEVGSGGLVEVPVESVQEGRVGNVPANSINTFPVALSGLIDVYNPEAFTNGYDAESDESLRERYYSSLQRPAKSGNKYHYEQWAMEVVGVGGVRVIPRYKGPLTMRLIIIDSNKQPASSSLINEVHSHVFEEAPFGLADLSVISAKGIPINIRVNLSVVEGVSETEVANDIKNEVREYLRGIAFEYGVVSYAQIGAIILDNAGVSDYENLKINGGISNVAIADDEVAIVGGVNQ